MSLTFTEFVVGDRVKVIGHDISGVVERVGKKITILPWGGRFDGVKLSLPPVLLIHSFGAQYRLTVLGMEIALFEA